MLNIHVKQIMMGAAFVFVAMIAGAASDTAMAQHGGSQTGVASGNADSGYHKYRRLRRLDQPGWHGNDNYRRRHDGGSRYYHNRHRRPYYGGSRFIFRFGYPYYDDYDYYDDYYYYSIRPTYGSCGRPWTKAWRRCCEAKYRSFDPETGRFLSYSGRWKMCR